MDLIFIIKTFFIGTSFGTLFFSLIFLLFPDLYFRIEDAVGRDLFGSTTFLTALEGRVNFLNDWIFKYRLLFGTLFVLLSLYNIRSLISLK
jgi:multisubunit Na+/H+ antiporter MnhG subunit